MKTGIIQTRTSEKRSVNICLFGERLNRMAKVKNMSAEQLKDHLKDQMVEWWKHNGLSVGFGHSDLQEIYDHVIGLKRRCKCGCLQEQCDAS